MNGKHIPCSDEARTFQCFFCPSGCVCLRWQRTLLLHFTRNDLARALDCLEDILKHPSCGFCLGVGAFCACHAADGQCYLSCQDRVVLRLSADDARGLLRELASAHAALVETEVAPGERWSCKEGARGLMIVVSLFSKARHSGRLPQIRTSLDKKMCDLAPVRRYSSSDRPRGHRLGIRFGFSCNWVLSS